MSKGERDIVSVVVVSKEGQILIARIPTDGHGATIFGLSEEDTVALETAQVNNDREAAKAILLRNVHDAKCLHCTIERADAYDMLEGMLAGGIEEGEEPESESDPAFPNGPTKPSFFAK